MFKVFPCFLEFDFWADFWTDFWADLGEVAAVEVGPLG